MAKVLIASIGRGRYAPTNYQIQDGNGELNSYYEKLTPRVLDRHFELDRVFLIGTPGSLWHEVYNAFCQSPQMEDCDPQYYEWLESCVQNHQANKNQLESLERKLDNKLKCIVLDEGVSERQIWSNFAQILESIGINQPQVDGLTENDRIYIDITHAFRSLALFQFLVFNFIKDILNEQNIQIAGVYYGLFDNSAPDTTPIVNLNPLLSLTEWTKGAYILKNIGNGYSISQLLNQEGQSDAANKVMRLSDAINLNYLDSIGERSINLQIALNRMDPVGPFQYVKPTLDNFVNDFATPEAQRSEPHFQLKIAEWHLQNRRYATFYITLTEAIVTYVCDCYGYKSNNRKDRQKIRDALGGDARFNRTALDKVRQTRLGALYSNEINPVRRHIAHASFSDISQQQLRNANPHAAVEKAGRRCQEVREIFEQGNNN